MPSYQDIESRLIAVEGLLDFISKAISVGQPSIIQGAPPRITTLKALYQESQAAGLTIAPAPEQENG